MKPLSVALVILLLSAAPVRAELAQPYTGPWTEPQLRVFCNYKAAAHYKNKNYYDSCMENNITIIGRPKNKAALRYFQAIYRYEYALLTGEDPATP